MNLSLRAPKDSDYLNSKLRHHVFKSLERMEVPRKKILGDETTDKYEYLLTDARNPLYQWQEAVAVEHFKRELAVSSSTIAFLSFVRLADLSAWLR